MEQAPTTGTINWKSLKNAQGIAINPNGTPQKSGVTGTIGGPGENLGSSTVAAGTTVTFWPSSDPLPDGTVDVGPIRGGDGSTPSVNLLRGERK